MMRWKFFLSFLLTVPAFAAPSFEEVKAQVHSSEFQLLDREGVTLQSVRQNSRERAREWTSLAEFSPNLVAELLKQEDKRFFSHGGADWLALGSALFHGKKSRGASTITMQLASFLDPHLKGEKGRRSISQKWHQIQAARALESTWSKKQILEAYLNLVPFRGELRGIPAAAEVFFQKKAHGLTEKESAFLVALLPQPNASEASLAARLCRRQELCGDRAFLEKALARKVNLKNELNFAPHVAQALKKTNARSTLRASLQKFAVDAMEKRLAELNGQNVQDAAALVLDNRTGEVLAYIGSSGKRSSAPLVDGVQAPRQAGSTLKPFLYALAFQKKLLTPATMLDDSPFEIALERGVYRPQNYDERFHGEVSVRAALAGSLNVPAVKTIDYVGVEPFADFLRGVGLPLEKEADHYGYALALGAAEVSLWNLTNAYRTLANGGQYSPATLSKPAASVRKSPLQEGSAFLISQILSDRESRSLSFGLENPLSTRFWAAVKTGTSKDMRDNWCIGYSSRYTVGIWVGNFSGTPMWNVSGISGAAPLWLDLISYLHREEPSLQPTKVPQTVVKHEGEWFLKGTEFQPGMNLVDPIRASQILYPKSGMILASDPSIPEGVERVLLESSSEGNWRLDHQPLGKGKTLSWRPTKGKHRLELLGTGGQATDEVKFEVR